MQPRTVRSPWKCRLGETKERSGNMSIEKLTMPAARKLKNLTQEDMANICDVSPSTVGNWEKGKTEISVAKAMLFAEACGLHYDDINFLPSVTV